MLITYFYLYYLKLDWYESRTIYVKSNLKDISFITFFFILRQVTAYGKLHWDSLMQFAINYIKNDINVIENL